MKAWMLLAALSVALPNLAVAGDTPSATARAERQRTIEKKKNRKAASQAAIARRNQAFREAADAEAPVLLEAAAANRASRSAQIGQYQSAVNAGMIQAYRTNPYLGGGGFTFGNPSFTPGFGALGVAPAYGATSLLGVPLAGGIPQVGPVLSVPGVGGTPAHVNKIGLNK